ncbi:MFS transporter [Arthrobacter sp. Cr_A7]|uniref:MFS transporter n=1 Tax=Arthrobacter sp. Cr_A7 TaxID=3031017 RepID=UPI0023D9EDB0|nr:MFS transporter [Arthrobacter sp. Cr_A7]MDF2050374.1 MFS transporter [Arthrobacter sp. Cr_A7]
MSRSGWRRALGAQAVLAQASWVGIRLIIGYRALFEGADPVFLGALASSFAVPALVAALPTGRLADRFGGTAIAFSGLLTAAAGTTAMLVIPGLAVLLAASAVIGLGHLMVMVGQQAFVAHVSSGGSRDSDFGTLTAAASIGQLIGPPAVTLAASLTVPPGAAPDTAVGLMVCLAFSALATPAFFFLRRTDAGLRRIRRHTDQPRANVAGVLKAPGLWRSLVVSGAVLVTVDLMYAFVPVWATQQGISAAVVGMLLALRAAVSVLSRLGLTRLISRFGRKSMLIVSIAAAVLSLAALPLVGVYGAIAVMVGLGLGLGIPQPLTMAWVVSLTASSSHGAVLGLRMTVNRLAQVTLPVAVGSFAAPLGVLGIFWVNAALLMAAIAVVAGSDAGSPPGVDDPA